MKDSLCRGTQINKQKCFVSCLYRSPSQTDEEFSPFRSVVLGDFNGKCNKWWIGDLNDHCGLELDTLCSLSGLSQLVKEPTTTYDLRVLILFFQVNQI